MQSANALCVPMKVTCAPFIRNLIVALFVREAIGSLRRETDYTGLLSRIEYGAQVMASGTLFLTHLTPGDPILILYQLSRLLNTLLVA